MENRNEKYGWPLELFSSRWKLITDHVRSGKFSHQWPRTIGGPKLLDKLVGFLHLPIDRVLVVPVISKRRMNIRKSNVGESGDNLIGRPALPFVKHVHVSHADAGTRDTRFARQRIGLYMLRQNEMP